MKLHKLNEHVYDLLTITVTLQKNDKKYRLKQIKAENFIHIQNTLLRQKSQELNNAFTEIKFSSYVGREEEWWYMHFYSSGPQKHCQIKQEFISSGSWKFLKATLLIILLVSNWSSFNPHLKLAYDLATSARSQQWLLLRSNYKLADIFSHYFK